MRVASVADVQTPLRTPSGEVIYELVGAAPETGGVKRHSVAVVVLPPHKSSDLHYHQVAEETYYMLHGTARMVIDGQVFPLHSGQACLIEPGERHQIFNDGDEELAFIAVCAPAWTADDSFFA